MRETFAKWYRAAWTKLFDSVWEGEDANFEKVGAKKVVSKAEKRMLPFDDVEEWLAVRLRAYDKRMVEIEGVPRDFLGRPTTRFSGRPLSESLKHFVSRSLKNSWYRRLLQAEVQTSYTLEHAKALRAKLAS